jgi:hypothetical protein
MTRRGLLETLAQGDLDALLETVGAAYRAGAAEELAARDPAWRLEIERAEREVGDLYAALCDADATLARWREAVAELRLLWARPGRPGGRAEPAGPPEVVAPLREVA